MLTIGSQQIDNLCIGLEYEHASIRFQALAQMHPGIAQTPSKVKNNIGFFQRQVGKQRPGLPNWIAGAVVGKAFVFKVWLPGPGGASLLCI